MTSTIITSTTYSTVSQRGETTQNIASCANKTTTLVKERERIINQIMAIHNRRGRSKTRYSESTNADAVDHDDDDDDDDDDDEPIDEPIDEDDQQELVESLQREAAVQSRFFQNVFGYGIGGMAIVFSLIFPLLCPDECTAEGTIVTLACGSHSVFSSAVHAWSIHPFVLKTSSTTTRSPPPPPPIIIDVALQVIPILLWLTGFLSTKDEDHFHLALLIGNIVTFIGSRLIYWDIQSTEKALENLDAARYKHKSL